MEHKNVEEETVLTYDEATDEMVDPNTGKRTPVCFMLSDEVEQEIMEKAKELHALCVKHMVPLLCTFVTAKESDGDQACLLGFLPGRRVPMRLRRASDVLRSESEGASSSDQVRGLLAALLGR